MTTVYLSNRLKATFKFSVSFGLPYKEGRIMIQRLSREEFRIMLDILRSDKNPMVQYRPKKDWRE